MPASVGQVCFFGIDNTTETQPHSLAASLPPHSLLYTQVDKIRGGETPATQDRLTMDNI